MDIFITGSSRKKKKKRRDYEPQMSKFTEIKP